MKSKINLILPFVLICLFSGLSFGHVCAHRTVSGTKHNTEHCHLPITEGEMAHLKLIVLDDATGKEVPFMFTLTREIDGKDFRPPNAVELTKLFDGHGDSSSRRNAKLPRSLGGPTWLVPGSFTADVPCGRWKLTVRRGMEYYTVTEKIDFKRGEVIERKIIPKRWVDMSQLGWFGGDDHIHCKTVNSDDIDMLMTWAKAETLNVSNLLFVGDIQKTYFETEGFGKERRKVDGDNAIVLGQEEPRTYDMGHVIGLNTKSLVRNTELYHCYDIIFDELDAQGAVVGYAHAHAAAFNLHRDMSLNMPKGKIDFLEIFEGGWLGTNRYYPWLNLGFKVTASAGTDVPWHGTIGEVRVYVYTGQKELDVDKWFESMLAGHTFVTNGPIIDFTVDDAIPGDTINLYKPKQLRVRARAWAVPKDLRPFRLEIIRNGEVINSIEQENPDQIELKLDFNINSEKGFWIAARVSDQSYIEFHNRAEALTTPVYVVQKGLRFWNYEKAEKIIKCQLAVLDEIEEMIQLAHKSKAEGKNLLNTKYQEWELDFRIERIIATEDAIRERINSAKDIYESLLSIHKKESKLR